MAEIKLKVTLEKGSGRQSFFDSLDMGDFEKLKFTKLKEKVERSRGLKNDEGELYYVLALGIFL